MSPDSKVSIGNPPAVIVYPQVLLQMLGYLRCALMYNPLDHNDFGLGSWQAAEQDDDVDRSEHEWEVWQVEDGPTYPGLVGSGATPVGAMLDALVNLIEGGQVSDSEESRLYEMAPFESMRLSELRLAVEVASKFLADRDAAKTDRNMWVQI